MKYINPAVLAGLTVNGVFDGVTNTESSFYNYPGWVQAVGITIVVMVLTSFVALAVFPSLWMSIFGDQRAPAEVAEKTSRQRRGPQAKESQGDKAPFMTDSMINS